MITWLRKYIGIIISVIGLAMLAILTFGDIGELFTDEYWKNVGGNLSSITALTIGLVMVQVSIKQGVSEQALSVGLNSEGTKRKYTEHKTIRQLCNDKLIYLPYFLAIRNERDTRRRKREFLIDNNFKSEKMLRLNTEKGLRKIKRNILIKKYDHIKTNITADSINWSTTDIVFTKDGKIEKLDQFRAKRLAKAIFVAIVTMIGTALIAGGLFLDTADVPIWQKVVKFISYIITMGITAIFDVSKNYEKGAFGVPNELDEINGVWKEFKDWDIPEWVKVEVEELENLKIDLNTQEEENEQEREDGIDCRTALQEESKES